MKETETLLLTDTEFAALLTAEGVAFNAALFAGLVDGELPANEAEQG